MTAPIYSAHLGYMFTEYTLEERFAAAARAGFAHIEHPGPYALPATQVRDLCAAHNLTFVQMALPVGNATRGEKGLAALSSRVTDFRASVAVGLHYAQAAGSGYVHVMSGVISDPTQRDTAWVTYIDNLRFACAEAAKGGMTLLIEPIGVATLADYFIDHPDKALRALEEVEAPNLKLLFDAFHATNAGIDAHIFVKRHADKIAHVHIADHPGRHEPGTGAFDFQQFFSILSDVDYRGCVGLEYIPASHTESGLHWREAFLSKQ
ncbi:hydroxypyruvate isomerase [Angulomicrobium tetraedrale]|uniref:Hydroxypyruvate isomerase n=1 Tax=Ancylobacter tetraedralis TaxID=217068 RepID=A0A839ZFT4_9HYPH|nr:TIM barrel protein [Ancylobacter tetraedralis]MBB3773820.1 hydroxypyruvate isomerase [Ancylobacter tetraedralis]